MLAFLFFDDIRLIYAMLDDAPLWGQWVTADWARHAVYEVSSVTQARNLVDMFVAVEER